MSSPTSALYEASTAVSDVADMTLEIEAPKDDDDEALALLQTHQNEPSAAASSANKPSPVSSSTRSRGGSNISAVYRWYEIEEGFSSKRREESSIARCKLCRQQGKLERKACVRFSKSVTSNLWRHLKENHPQVYEKHAGEKKSVQMHRVAGAKKRGRKKKLLPTAEEDQDKLMTQSEEGEGAAAMQKAVKKAKRGELHTHLFPEYQPMLQQTTGGRQTEMGAGAAAGAVLSGNFNPEKVREAMGYLCLYEMLPFELCSSHAFRNLMVECSGGSGGYVDDSNSFALFAKEIAFGYAKKMSAEVKVRTVMQMKMTDFAHLMISEWRSSDCAGENDTVVGTSALSRDTSGALKKYFALHKDGISDFSKLIQLSSLSRYEWSRAGYLKTLLKPFADATAKLDGEKYFVSSLIVPSISTLLEKLQHPQDTCSGFAEKSNDTKEPVGELPEDIEALRGLANANLSACFGHLFAVPEESWNTEKRETFNLLWSATILDPRTRPFIIKGPLSQQEFWEVVKAEAANIAGTKKKDKENSNDLVENTISLDEEDNHLDGNGVGKSSDLWDDLQANLTSCAQEEMLLSSSKTSLEITKSSNLLEVEVSFFQEEGSIPLRANPLEWWQNMRMKYPFLARLARYVLSIPCNVKVHDNPVLCDGGLVKRAPCEMSLPDVCDLLAASMNLRTEKNAHFEAASKQMWSTV
ncbi:hypothetical protein BBO99_00002808 [Phytophthora kernoviae]|uniref:HAT C-terminal dimerisation domain-containing protein n=2 Tax=Phytophthora kernoviae TaxID=325452 RepID=A0A421FFD7_9STRA|nr:hypothetical protein G195_003282 [Phytophthora kernoviae 00238/432]KAG2524630.1 hypothetical protein JM16_002200 [Phytophthora kernoviae]KAG2527870.1 hypothetical protein JM18_003507 [Phytophthora kernoviae]RLN44046.1 hypothetical protein BBI17_002718 [Phytophthora kernoviae]RLN82577.1 hypothetical protein BBO99_00002808 [Phytophthora kernoviae]